MKAWSKRKKAAVLYGVVSLILIFLSMIGLFFGEWASVAVTSVSVLFGFLNLLIYLHGDGDIAPDGLKASFALHALLRCLVLIAALTVSALIVYFSMDEPAQRVRYSMVLLSALPFLTDTAIVVYVGMKE